MRRRVIAGNWKMYKTQGEARAFIAALAPLVASANHCDIVIAPPFTALAAAVEAARGTAIRVAAQNLYWEAEGAFTGEISTRTLLGDWNGPHGHAGIGGRGAPVPAATSCGGVYAGTRRRTADSLRGQRQA